MIMAMVGGGKASLFYETSVLLITFILGGSCC